MSGVHGYALCRCSSRGTEVVVYSVVFLFRWTGGYVRNRERERERESR